MPPHNYREDVIQYALSTDWATTTEFNDIAKKHCGATAVTNIALYYARRHTNLKVNDSVRETFKKVHAIVGNGPKMTIADDAKKYVSDRGYRLKYTSAGTFDDIKNAVRSDHPTAILLQNGIVDWHWILGVGYRVYFSGDKYIRIVDGWHDTTEKYYRPFSGSLWWSATEYVVTRK